MLTQRDLTRVSETAHEFLVLSNCHGFLDRNFWEVDFNIFLQIVTERASLSRNDCLIKRVFNESKIHLTCRDAPESRVAS